MEALSSGDFEFDVTDDVTTKPEKRPRADVDDAPVVRYLQKMLLDAINAAPPTSTSSPTRSLPHPLPHRRRAARDRPAAARDQGQARLAHQGHLAARHLGEARAAGRPHEAEVRQQRAIDFRVSTLPTLFGEKIVMRILDPSSAKLGIEALGYEPEQKERADARDRAALRHGAGDRPDRLAARRCRSTPA